MGHQQLLLIILGVIVVGIAVVAGVALFDDNAVSANRDAVSADLASLAGRARQYFQRPASTGGGGNSFVGLTADAAGLARLTSLPGGKNENGVYAVTVSGTATEVVIEGIGDQITANGNPVRIDIYVRDGCRPDSLVIIN